MTNQEIRDKFSYLYSKINWGDSFLDAKAITIMNTLQRDIIKELNQLDPSRATSGDRRVVGYQPRWNEREMKRGSIEDSKGGEWTETEAVKNIRDAQKLFPGRELITVHEGDIDDLTFPALDNDYE